MTADRNSSRGKRDLPEAKIAAFLALTLALSAVSWAVMTRAGTGAGFSVLTPVWCPGVASLVVTLAFQRNLRGLGWRLGKPRYMLAGYAAPILYAAAAYLVVWLVGLGAFAQAGVPGGRGGLPSYPALTAMLGIRPSVVSALGEEIGWRGLLVPHLARITNPTGTALLGGLVWAAWHSTR